MIYYLVDVVGIGSTALQEYRRYPYIDKSTMSSEEKHREQYLRQIDCSDGVEEDIENIVLFEQAL